MRLLSTSFVVQRQPYVSIFVSCSVRYSLPFTSLNVTEVTALFVATAAAYCSAATSPPAAPSLPLLPERLRGINSAMTIGGA